jgi:hypothetical protein
VDQTFVVLVLVPVGARTVAVVVVVRMVVVVVERMVVVEVERMVVVVVVRMVAVVVVLAEDLNAWLREVVVDCRSNNSCKFSCIWMLLKLHRTVQVERNIHKFSKSCTGSAIQYHSRHIR